jgi:hypothetical protein
VNRQGREFKDLDYPNEEDMIDKLKKMLKGISSYVPVKI